MTINELCEKYGYLGISVTVREFIRRSPEFPGDKALAKVLGEMLADLESVLTNREH